jgi:ATP-dependent RNA helicase DeaD
VDIVVATPGRAIDHLKRKTLKLNDVKFVVLDEADEMLNMGFVEDIETILSHVPEQRRMLLFSATMPSAILNLAKKFMGEYDEVKMASKQQSAANVEQVFYEIQEKDKLRALHRLIETEAEFYALVFCRTRLGADRLASKLSGLGLDVEALHGDVTQVQRERILAKFKSGHATILVATDVAARGIDINNLSHVINFDMPDSPENYVHRIGRTARAGKTGKAISFIAPGEWRKLQFIMQLTKATINKAFLPSGQEVIELNKKAMKEQVFAATGAEVSQEFYNLAEEVLSSGKPKQLLASLLQLHFGGHLNPHAYPEIREPERPVFHSRHNNLERRSYSKPPTRQFGKREQAPVHSGKAPFRKRSKSMAR